MLTTSPILTTDAKNASPRAFQFAPSRSPLHGPSSARQRSRSWTNSNPPQSSTAVATSTPGRAMPGPMASPSKLRAPESAQENSNLTNGSSHTDAATGIVVPVEPSDVPANPPAAQKQSPQRSQTSQSKLGAAKRSASSPAPPGAEPQQAVNHAAALQEADRPARRAKTLPASPKTLPLAYETCSVGDMVVLIAHMVSELIETNDGLALSSGNLTRFHSRYTQSSVLCVRCCANIRLQNCTGNFSPRLP